MILLDCYTEKKMGTLNASWQVKIATVNTGGQIIMGQACMIQYINPTILMPPLWGQV